MVCVKTMTELIIDELSREEKILLLKAFNYDIDEDDKIVNVDGSLVLSQEQPLQGIHIDHVMMVPGSLKILDGTATAVSKHLREIFESNNRS